MASHPEIAIDFPVVIIGGGPTGLALAIELGTKRVACAVFEQNATAETFPKASANGARTLEHYRRLGFVPGMRRIGFSHETAFFTRLAQDELARLRLSGMDSLTRDDAAPGSRMPHLWLDRQISTLDRVQGKFTLFTLGGAATKVAPLRNAADRHGAPLDIVDIEHTEVRDAYGFDLVLIRPDQHIDWRGNSITSVAEKLLRKATGWQ